MKRLVKLKDANGDDLAILPHHVNAIRRAGFDEDQDQTAIYMVGQSAIDGGFLVNRDFDDVFEEINECLANEAED